MNKGQVGIGTLMLLFIGVIVAVALLPQIAQNTNELQNKFSVTNESVDTSAARINSSTYNSSYELAVANAPTGWDVDNCPLTGVVVYNQTGDALGSGEYTFTEAYGNFTLTANSNNLTSSGLNFTTVDYTYCPEGYASTGAARAMANVILIFTALGLLAFALYHSVKQFF